MRTFPSLAAGLILGTLGGLTTFAAAQAQPGRIAGRAIETVEWHPSTRHWDHHFHAHQDSLRYHQPTEAERRINRLTRRLAPSADAAAPHYRLGKRAGGPRD